MINPDNFAKNLLAIMKLHGVTTAKLSANINIPEITINKLRNGQNKNPTMGTVIPIAKYFRVSLDELFSDENKSAQFKIPIITMDGSKPSSDNFYLDKYSAEIDLVIEVTSESYPDFKKGSLLLVRNSDVCNEDLVLARLNDYIIPCKLVIECGIYTGKSLIYSDKYYQISIDNILGVIVGIIWKKN
jgi:transcriptional regulator with XRE-family HTH domain